MNLVASLLNAILRLDGDALVMHVGDKPYVVSPTGQVDLAARGLSLEAVVGVVNQLLSVEAQNALDEFGAAQYELPPMPEFPSEHFTIVAARGGDDVWAEVRRRRTDEADRIPEDVFASTAAPAADAAPPSTTLSASVPADEGLLLPDEEELFPESNQPAAVASEDENDLTLNEPPAAAAAPILPITPPPMPLPAVTPL
ncbi:MAG TPA: hypothetical protein VFI22_12340, partial [Thermomicrobiales bacterium]|nr:hypothetical protein [Thermomicrobiales bacterium]